MGRKRRNLIVIDGKVVEVKTHNDTPIWDLLKLFINSVKINKTFTRKDLLNSVYNVPMYSYQTTVDTYRNNLTNLGFLEIAGTGIYKKLYNIPEEVTTSHIGKALKDRNTWKGWFIPLCERMGVDKSVDLPKY